MNKIIYTMPDGTLAIVHPAPKSSVETVIGRELTDNEYSAIVKRSIPENASHRDVTDDDIPTNYICFREIWEDTQPGTQIDINLGKAQELQLKFLRNNRDAQLKKLDGRHMAALSTGNESELTKVNNKKQALRDATNPLKALNVSGYNNTNVLDQIIELGTLEDDNDANDG